MPTLSKKSAGAKEKSKTPKKGKVERPEKAKRDGRAEQQKALRKSRVAKPTTIEDDEILDEVSPAQVDYDSEENRAPDVSDTVNAEETVGPMTGDIVTPALASLLIVPRIAGEELDTLKGFLRYYTLTEMFVGSIASKTSFMRKKGGVLL